jgi:membrane carboxypeptidase/penicillin-binding protein
MPDPDWKRRIEGENWSTGDTYNAAFGQGYVTVTPLQLISAVAAIANGGTLYQPTIINSFLDAEGNVIEGFTPHVARTLRLPQAGQPAVLLCDRGHDPSGQQQSGWHLEPDSEFYDANACQPQTYQASLIHDGVEIPYTVNVPRNYVFNGSVCNRNRFDPDYQPPFVDLENFRIVEEGMRMAVTEGTAKNTTLTYRRWRARPACRILRRCRPAAGPVCARQLAVRTPGSWLRAI